jgi:hypothetical protein
MLRRAIVLAAAVALAACGDDNNQPSDLTAADVAGIWDFTANACFSGSLPVRLNPASDGSLAGFQNNWTTSEATIGFILPLDGSVDFSSAGIQMNLWADNDHTQGMVITGTMTSDGLFAGSVTDPNPGFAPLFHPTGSPPCLGTVNGTKR